MADDATAAIEDDEVDDRVIVLQAIAGRSNEFEMMITEEEAETDSSVIDPNEVTA